MKRTYQYQAGNKTVTREINYIPVRYIIAMLLTVFEVLAIIGVVVLLCYFVPYFYLAAWATEIACVIKIISSDDNPDYKVPWLLFVLILPIAGFMLYFIFASRKLKGKYVRRLRDLKSLSYEKDDSAAFSALYGEDRVAHNTARMLCSIADCSLFENTKTTYFPLGEDMMAALLRDLAEARSFIYMEYFIIEEGKFFDSILEILRQKAAEGVSVKLLYDDIGCMSTLPGNYAKVLQKMGIEAAPFSRLRGNADSEFNNRSHRKITVIDGRIGYTGGINLADEYINERVRFGHWKDTAIRLEGEAVFELTRLFLTDFGINVRHMPSPDHVLYPTDIQCPPNGYVIPFGDGPAPLYRRRVSKSLLQTMLAGATRYAYMTTPYLIIDNDLCTSLENAALRGVDVRIIVPHVPDKRIVFNMTQSFYPRLMHAGVRIYEYTPGFIHAKSYLVDDKYAMIGTVNLDYRSLVHHFENGVWMWNTDAIADLREDIEKTMAASLPVEQHMLKVSLPQRMLRALVRIFAPLL
ncbi:MAG: cardiolipin synthase [Ruminococcaceae bacterium]|nr:cardiolipin synthase [Oscillospiraceae bacterium]